MFNHNGNFAGARIALILALLVGLMGVTPAAAGDGGSVLEVENSTRYVQIQTSADPVHIKSGESKLVPFSIVGTEKIAGMITNRTYQFFTQYDVPLSEPFGPFPASIEVNSAGTASWNELVYLPKAVANKARSIKDYAIVLKTTFNGTLQSGQNLSANSSLLLLLPPDNFSKVSPADGAIVTPGRRILVWDSSVGAVDYDYCFDTIDNNSCDTNWTGTYDTFVAAENLPSEATFYWQARANNTSGTTYANNGDWWEFATANFPPGSLDPTFDGDGLVTTPIGPFGDQAGAIAIQLDGKILVAGKFRNGGFDDFLLARYNEDGSLDFSFGTDGIVSTDFGETDVASAIAIQSDLKIVVAGYSEPANSDAKFAIVRYNPDGTLDTTFDLDGKLLTNLGTGYDYARAIALQTDGKIVAAGVKNIGINNNDIALVRYLSNGALDPTFDGDGIATIEIGSGSNEFASSVALQPDGKILVGGTAHNGSDTNLVLVRFDGTGVLDSVFDLDGKVTTDFGLGFERGGHVALKSDGKILIAGDDQNGNFLIARYDQFGSLDPNFGVGGRAVSVFSGSSDDQVQDIVLQQDNKIILAGHTRSAFGSNSYDFALARFHSNGSLDNSFSSDGKLTTDFGGNQDELGMSAAIQADGKIVVAGYRYIGGSNSDVAIARYLGDSPEIHYVDLNATGANNGNSWNDAFTDLQSAFSAASAGDEIWVAAGTYKPTTGINREVSFTLVNGVAVYGGFSGSETSLAQRDFQSNITILSGDIGASDYSADNSYHVLTAVNANGSTLDGFTVTGGNADSFQMGGGLSIENSNLNVSNVVFIDNFATFGGGIHNIQEDQFLQQTSLVLTDVKFSNNSAFEGGGLRSIGYTNTILNRVVFDSNSADRAGGGMTILEGHAVLTDVVFSNNSAVPLGSGGGLLNWYGDDPELTNVTFVNNSADLGGGMGNYGSSPLLTNVTFTGNSAITYGGAIVNEEDGLPRIANATISENSAEEGGGIYNEASGGIVDVRNSILYDNIGGEIVNEVGTATVTYSIVEGGYTGTGNLDIDPLLGPLQNNGGFTETMALLSGSPAIDAANDAFCPATDQRGVTRPQGSHCDIGAYEFEGSVPTPTFTPSLTLTPTFTPTIAPSNTATPLVPTATYTPTRTPKGAQTNTPTLTSTPIMPTATHTFTPHPPTVTFTPSLTVTATNVVGLPAELNKSFSPISIATGGTSRLSVTIFNPNLFNLTNASWTDNLPAGVTFANPVNPSNTCGGIVSAVSGGTTLQLSGGTVLAQGSCTVAINVTSSMPGNFVNTIPVGALITANNVTNTTPASATLNVIASTATFTPTSGGKRTSTPTPLNTPTRTTTPVPPTFTLTPSPTFVPTTTEVSATPTWMSTNTSLPPTATFTPGSSGFPSTSVLDTFNRANGSIGTNWGGFPTAFAIASKQLDVVSSGVNTSIFWKNASFGADQEAHVRLTQIDTGSGSEHRLILKSQSSKSSSSGLISVRYDALGQTVQVWTFHPTQGWVQHGANIPVTFVNGDQFGARARADGTVEVYKNGELLATRSVTSWPFYANGGYIGLWLVNSPNAILDDFGGGTTPP